jgi:clan AA aspartic protease (TIGR02281 family)
MRFLLVVAVTGYLLCLFGTPAGLAQSTRAGERKSANIPAEQLLEDKELKKRGTTYVLAGEIELGKLAQTQTINSLKSDVQKAARQLAEVDGREQVRKTKIDRYTQRVAQLAVLLKNTANINVRNNLVSESNALNAQLIQLHKGTDDGVDVVQQLSDARRQSAQAREAFVDHVLKMRHLADRLAGEYPALASDEEVAKALAAMAGPEGKKFTLGPAAGYKAGVARLKLLERSIRSESVKLRHGDGKTYYVDVVVGGKPPQEFIVDTGASAVSLAWDLAAKLDLKPDRSSPVVRCSLADGREVDAHCVIAKSIRVGQFAAENVECLVMPPELGNAPPLLGMTFLGNFNCRINVESGTMTLAKVEVDAPQRTKSKKSAM